VDLFSIYRCYLCRPPNHERQSTYRELSRDHPAWWEHRFERVSSRRQGTGISARKYTAAMPDRHVAGPGDRETGRLSKRDLQRPLALGGRSPQIASGRLPRSSRGAAVPAPGADFPAACAAIFGVESFAADAAAPTPGLTILLAQSGNWNRRRRSCFIRRARPKGPGRGAFVDWRPSAPLGRQFHARRTAGTPSGLR